MTSRARLLFWFGIALIPTVSLFCALLSSKSYISEDTRQLPGPDQKHAIHDFISFACTVPAYVKVEVPAVVHVGEPLPIILTFEIRDQEQYKAEDLHILLYNPPEFNLSGAGVEVEPKEWLTLYPFRRSTVTWSVKGVEPGTFTLVLNVRKKFPDYEKQSPESSTKSDARGTTSVTDSFPAGLAFVGAIHDKNIMITVKRKWSDYATLGITATAAFMGSLFTLPGIIAFFEDRKKETQRASSLN